MWKVRSWFCAMAARRGKILTVRVAGNLWLAISLSAALAVSQTPSPIARPGFDVVSIRSAAPDAENSFVMRQLGRGVMDLERYPLTLAIQAALHAKPFEITGLPSWVASARYDIRAKTAEPATAEEMWPMLLPVLEERFKMQVHREKQEKPVYELSVSKSGKL